jgi:hypothetical protein
MRTRKAFFSVFFSSSHRVVACFLSFLLFSSPALGDDLVLPLLETASADNSLFLLENVCVRARVWCACFSVCEEKTNERKERDIERMSPPPRKLIRRPLKRRKQRKKKRWCSHFCRCSPLSCSLVLRFVFSRSLFDVRQVVCLSLFPCPEEPLTHLFFFCFSPPTCHKGGIRRAARPRRRYVFFVCVTHLEKPLFTFVIFSFSFVFCFSFCFRSRSCFFRLFSGSGRVSGERPNKS